MPEEARLEPVASGLAPASDGWFVVNTCDAAWITNDYFGGICIFEADDFVIEGRPDLEEHVFDHAGFTLHVVMPGQPSSLYHRESEQQEDFLVLIGECMLVIEEEERHLRTWDFVHCPPETAHTFVGAGTGPCVILGAGNRTDTSQIVRPRSELALRYGAGVEEETTSFPHDRYGAWKLQHPPTWRELPWVTS